MKKIYVKKFIIIGLILSFLPVLSSLLYGFLIWSGYFDNPDYLLIIYFIPIAIGGEWYEFVFNLYFSLFGASYAINEYAVLAANLTTSFFIFTIPMYLIGKIIDYLISYIKRTELSFLKIRKGVKDLFT